MSPTSPTGPSLTPGSSKSASSPGSQNNHNLTSRIMTVDDHEQPPATTQNGNEDPATNAASEELKHTTITDKPSAERRDMLDTTETEIESTSEDKVMHETDPTSSPPVLSAERDEEMRERLSSPKKKRGRDQDDDERALQAEEEDRGSSADGDAVNGGKSKRLERLEPEKKRVRDGSEELSAAILEADSAQDKDSKATVDLSISISEKKDKETDLQDKATTKSIPKENSQTSSSAFASSGFASLAGATASPFGAVGASKPSVFGGGSTASGFGALSGSKSPPLASAGNTGSGGFGALGGNKTTSGFGFGIGATAGFGGLGGGSAFGSTLGSGFGGSSGSKLSSFAAPAGGPAATSTAKPVKAFGAPEIDEEGGSDEDGTEGGAGSEDEEVTPGNVSPEDRKKSKLQKVPVDDGEAGEATLLQIRAKLFAISSTDNAWKERGVGTLKINVPKSCVAMDFSDHPIPGSFNPMGLNDDDERTGPTVPRLILRQENTHRVILNTALLKNMKFQDKQGATAAQIFFTAIEGDKEPKPVNMLLKMSEQNAVAFRAEVASIQREL